MAEGWALRHELRDEKQKLARLARIEELETQVFERASGVIDAVLAFAEISPTQTEPPPDWVALYGEEGAKQRLEVAKTGWMPMSIAPAGVNYALKAVAGIKGGRNHRNAKLVQNNLNVVLKLPQPTTAAHPGPITYEVMDIE